MNTRIPLISVLAAASLATAARSARATLRTDGLGRFSAPGRARAAARLRVAVPAQPGYLYAHGAGRP